MNFSSRSRIAVFRIMSALFVFSCICCRGDDAEKQNQTDRLPDIEPDYSGIVIPPNMAPLNFFIKEEGKEFEARIFSARGETIQIHSNTGSMQIPEKEWKNLLDCNNGEKLNIEISVMDREGKWNRFRSAEDRIAREPIDAYLTYRKFRPLFNLWREMGIYQRCLETFSEKPLFINRLANGGCMNCHNFWKNGTERWLLHLRGGYGTSMLLDIDGKVSKVDTKTDFSGPTAYPAWHPSGKIIALSVNSLILFFHEAGECRDVLDRSSNIVIYDVSENTITAVPQIADPDRLEIWPAWSPDGKNLYFCSCPKMQEIGKFGGAEPFAYDKIKYDLMRVSYDPEKNTWGKPETVIAAKDIGLSITEPRISPDGRFLLFTAARYSQFPIYIESADLYLLDLSTEKWKRLDINSDRADSFHSWSADGRWIVFSSKRDDGLFTRPYFSYIDTLGAASKPFVLPQEDPLSYGNSLDIFNVPEFTKEPVRTSPQVLAEAASSEGLKAVPGSNSILQQTSGKGNTAGKDTAAYR